jgi:hypothetical protein
MNSQVEQFVAFIGEREAIRRRREAGQPWPWTSDPILRDYKFCNMCREDDRVTKGVAALYREPHQADPELWFALLVARRAVNWPDTLAELGYPVPWNPEHFKALIRKRQSAGQKAFEAQAYKVLVSGHSGEQADLITRFVLTPFWERRDYYRPRPDDTLTSFAQRLARAQFMGPFFAGQVTADLKRVQLTNSPDWWTFAVSGPGSRRGLDRLHGRKPRKYWCQQDYERQEALWYPEFLTLYHAVREPIQLATGLNLDAQDVQNCLCEFDKYCRLQQGDGERTVRRYTHVSSAEPHPLTPPATIPAIKEKTMLETGVVGRGNTEQQIPRLQARWKEIAGTAINTAKWAEPTELQWRALLQKVPFLVLYEDVLGRLNAYRGSVRTDATTYLSMIVTNDGPKFMAARGLSRPRFVDDEDEQVVYVPKAPTGRPRTQPDLA